MSDHARDADTASDASSCSDALRHAEIALNGVCGLLPHLSGLAARVAIQADTRVDTACIFASGRLLIHPDWFLQLKVNEAIFVLAHELMHLALQSHPRMQGAEAGLFNIAHDFIINDMLRTELDCAIPAGGLDLYGAEDLSAERLVADMREKVKKGEELPESMWSADPGANAERRLTPGALNSSIADALQRAGMKGVTPGPVLKVRGDALSEEREREWFPEEDPHDIRDWQEEIRAAAVEAVNLGVLRRSIEVQEQRSRGVEAGRSFGMVIAQQALYAPPWELALQRWMESTAPGPRSYARPSRRGADRTDVALPGRKREGWTLHIVLDTSGSMTASLPVLLGAIARFCEVLNVAAVHLLQCDVEVTQNEMVLPEALSNFRASGFGGSDMTPAMQRLAQDPEVEAALVLTDGYIAYPREPMPYDVLWVLDGPSYFSPPYGTVLRLDPDMALPLEEVDLEDYDLGEDDDEQN